MDNQNNEDIFKAYKDQLFSELKLSELPPEEKAKYEEKIAILVQNRLMNLILIHLPEEKIDDFNKVLDSENQEEVFKFIGENIPDFGAKVAAELMEIRNDIIKSK